ncbi:unnamed protein product [Effrenium voratum]|uniref:Uncharacterized protein n=1 Tax=Effrenium voratum TaxID=2562239 RepID=A0AA36J5Y1_9DINO|nr:unnamed protein product [Effrenium voratum]CAJ1421166.1 unnamed protein product [Effrenium voratum]
MEDNGTVTTEPEQIDTDANLRMDDGHAGDQIAWIYYWPVLNLMYDSFLHAPETGQLKEIMETYTLISGLLLVSLFPVLTLFQPYTVEVAKARNWTGSYNAYEACIFAALIFSCTALFQTVLVYLLTRATDFKGSQGQLVRAYKAWWTFNRWNLVSIFLCTLLGSFSLFFTVEHAFILQHAVTEEEAVALREAFNWCYFLWVLLGLLLPLAIQSLALLRKQKALQEATECRPRSTRRMFPHIPLLNVAGDMLFNEVPELSQIKAIMKMLSVLLSLLVSIALPVVQAFQFDKAATARENNWDGSYTEFQSCAIKGFAFISAAFLQLLLVLVFTSKTRFEVVVGFKEHKDLDCKNGVEDPQVNAECHQIIGASHELSTTDEVGTRGSERAGCSTSGLSPAAVAGIEGQISADSELWLDTGKEAPVWLHHQQGMSPAASQAPEKVRGDVIDVETLRKAPLAAWWEVSRWNFLLIGLCASVGGAFLNMAALRVKKLQHAQSELEAKVLSQKQDEQNYGIILALGACLTLMLLSAASWRRWRLLEATRSTDSTEGAAHRCNREVGHYIYFIPGVNLFYDFFVVGQPDREQVNSLVETVTVSVALLLSASASFLILFNHEESENARGRNWDNSYFEYEQQSSLGFALLTGSLGSGFLNYLAVVRTDFKTSGKISGAFQSWWSWSRLSVLLLLLGLYYGGFLVFMAATRIYNVQHMENEEEGLALWGWQENISDVFLAAWGSAGSLVVLSLALLSKERARSNLRPGRVSRQEVTCQWLYRVPILNLLFDFLWDETPAREQLGALSEFFGFLSGLFAGVTFHMFHLFHFEDAAVARAHNWTGTYSKFEACSHYSWILCSLTFLVWMQWGVFGMTTNFKTGVDHEQDSVTLLTAWWYWARWLAALMLLYVVGNVIFLNWTAGLAYILQHASTEAEANAWESEFNWMSQVFVICFGCACPIGMLSFSLARSHQEALRQTTRPCSGHAQQAHQQNFIWQYRIPFWNVIYDLLFDTPPTKNQMREMLSVLGLVNGLLLSVLLPIMTKFQPEDVLVLKRRDVQLLEFRERFRVCVSLGCATMASALLQVLFTFVFANVSAAFDAGQASVRRWWAIQRWIIVSIGVFTAMGSTCLLASGVFAYVLQHALTAEEERILTSRLISLCLITVLGGGVLFPVSLLSGGLRWRSFADGRE